MPSFSSSLLDAIYHSIDEPPPPAHHRRRDNNADEGVESLRRAIMVEKWMENRSGRHDPSSSSDSSTDSIFFSSYSETADSSKPTPRPVIPSSKHLEGRFNETKSRALKIYGDLKKSREPTSPAGRKIAAFFSSVFSPRNSKKARDGRSSVVRKSRSCPSKNPSPSTCNKSKRSVRFCTVNTVLDEDDCRVSSSIGFLIHQQVKNTRRFSEFLENERHVDDDGDDESCVSSDLFELENIGLGVYDDDDDEELPLYESTNLGMMNNKVIC